MALPDVFDADSWLTNEHKAWLLAWQPVTTMDSLDAASGLLSVRLGGADYVIARGTSESGLRAYPDRCPDGSAALSAGRIDGDHLLCQHEVRYSLVPDELGSLDVTERYGLVWLAPAGSVGELPDVPEWGDPDYLTLPMPVQDWNASAAQMADNFLDVGHFPFTHRFSIGDPNDREVHEYSVHRQPWSFSVLHTHSAKTLTDSRGNDGTYTTTVRTMKFVGTAPHHVYLRIHYQDSGTDLALCFFHQAVDLNVTRLYAIQLTNGTGPGFTESEMLDFQTMVGNEDKGLLEQFEVKGIPKRIGDELHVRADRITVELRRMLAELVALSAS